ncbi:MAG: ribosome maturation factor RimM [Holosporales bacterium]|jgi:16S rRNA processing protein RimM|nr:ribosome maturation factor RimM [Holosporales bacterium]
MVCVGSIIKSIGIRGLVKIQPYTSSPSFFLERNLFFLDSLKEIMLFDQKINKKNEVLSYIKGYSDRTAVDSLKLKKLFVLRNTLPILEENEYYLNDLSNLIVFNKAKNELGKVSAAFDYGAGVFLDIKLNNSNTIATIQFKKNSILSVNIIEKHLIIDEDFLIK